MNMKFFKKLPLWTKVLVALPAVILFLSLLFITLIGAGFYADSKTEKLIDKKFHEEVVQVPELKVESFTLWEGDSIVEANIEGKGSVHFWYGKEGIPNINAFNGYWVLGKCFYPDNEGGYIEYAFDQNLVLDKDSELKKWFPFEVNNLRDLVDRYDQIKEILDKFPTNPERIEVDTEKGYKTLVVKVRNPEYVLRKQFEGREVTCELYRYR